MVTITKALELFISREEDQPVITLREKLKFDNGAGYGRLVQERFWPKDTPMPHSVQGLMAIVDMGKSESFKRKNVPGVGYTFDGKSYWLRNPSMQVLSDLGFDTEALARE